MRTILLQLDAGGYQRCEAWTHVPVANGVQITVYTESSSGAAYHCAADCFAKIELAFMNAGGKKTNAPCVVDHGHVFPAHTCAGAVPGLHKRILVYIVDGTGSIDTTILQYFLHASALIIPVADTSFGTNWATLLPQGMRRCVAQPIDGFQIAPIIPRILRAAGVLDKGFRLFISYRHDEAASLAGQLFHALSERMFDVFLDRFSSRTGDDFVALIKEELFDKACVLVLETAGIGQSVYCWQEVSTATAYYLGLMALDLPGSQQTFAGIFRRHNLKHSGYAPGRELNNADLKDVIDFIERYYDHEIARRPRAQDLELHKAIRAAGLTPKLVSVGQYRVNNGSREYFISMNRCPPELDDFINAEEQALAAPPASGVVLGPISMVRALRAQQIGWLGDKSNIQPIDEGFTMRTLQNIAAKKPL